MPKKKTTKKKTVKRKKVRKFVHRNEVIMVKSVVALQKAMDEARENARGDHVYIEYLCTVNTIPWFLLGWTEK